MNISEYRDQFASYNSSRELARYRQHVGLTSQVTDHEIFDRYSDLFSLESINELKKLLESRPADSGTETRALQRLLGTAQNWFVEARVREVTEELARCEAATAIQWRGEDLKLEQVAVRLAKEPKPQRLELGARWIDAIAECDELRLNRLALVNNSARALGFASYYDLMFKAGDTKMDDVQRAARSLLEQTESAYKSALTKRVARELPEGRLRDLDYADLPYFTAASWLDRYLPAKDLLRLYAETMRGMGIHIGRQSNLQIDIEPRSSRKPAAACFPVRPPEDVRLAVMLSDGAMEFLNGQQQLGKAQHYAWCSKELAQRHPEFVTSPDSATADAFGYLFKYLALDPKWSLEFLPEIESTRAGAIATDVAMQMSLDLRSLCAGVLFEPSLSDELLSPEQMQATYVDLYERATSFLQRPEPFLLNLENGLQPGCQLRALAFSFGLREYLRVRYGHRWWASRKAGDELIDLWSTASQYSVEELASLIGFGELSFDLLAETINMTLSGA
ncbi:MAG: hypothetical protein JWM21_4616 [Acidobacteria bacterium]|nr:hypothetical protein [Acidobacteriota bacterium]